MNIATKDFERRLYVYWNQFVMRFGISSRQHFIFDAIRSRYDEVGRRYHGIKHPVILLDELKIARQQMPQWFVDSERDAAIELAIWEHDIVYDSSVSDNEEQSAAIAQQHARELGFSSQIGARVRDLVLATKHVAVPTELDAQIVAAIDLSPLAGSWEDFTHDSRDIREEYSHVSDKDFKRGRRDFLGCLLRRPRIYGTDYFHKKFEILARENLGRALREQLGTLLKKV